MSDNFQTWEKKRKLGEGGFGEVWEVRTDKDLLLAAKYINLSNKDVKVQDVQREVDILRQLKHKNVVVFITAKQQDGMLIVFTELIDGRDLASLGRLDETRAVGFLRQICDGLSYMHSLRKPVLHCDLKGENVMVARDGTVKIIDFGLSINLLVASGMRTTDVLVTIAGFCCTPPFVAPELFSNDHFSVKSDIWALGITVYQMIAGKPPFRDLHWKAIAEIVTASGAPKLPAGSEKLADFYASCTAKKPGDRPPVRQLLQHAVFSA